MKSNELKQLRNQKLQEMGSLIDNKNKEDRSFSDAEKVRFDGLEVEIKDLDSKIVDAEKEEEIKLRLAGSAPAIVRNKEQYSLIGHINAVRSGKLEGVFAEAQKQGESELRNAGVAINSSAVYVPANYVRDFSVTGDSGTKGGNMVETNKGSIIESLYEGSLLDKVGASRMLGLTGNLDLPKGGKVVSTWVTENGTIAKSDHVIGNIALRPNRLATRFPVSNLLLTQTAGSVETYLRNEIEKSIQKAIDEKFIANLLASADILPIVNGVDGAALTVAKVQEFVELVGKADVDIAFAKYLINYDVWAALKALPKASGSDKFMLENGLIDGMPFVLSNRVPANLTKGSGTGLSAMAFGDFSSTIVAQWGAVEILVDPYSASAEGQTIMNVGSYWDIVNKHYEGVAVSKDIVA